MIALCACRTRPPRALLGALVAFALLFALPAAPAAAADATEGGSVAVGSWLVLGPEVVPLPAFHDAARHGVVPADLLAGSGLVGEAPWPADGTAVTLPTGGTAAWRTVSAGDDGVDLGAPAPAGGDDDGGSTPRRAWLALRLDVSRFVTPQLAVRSAHPLRVWLDGEMVAEKGSDTGAGDDDAPDDDRAAAGEESAAAGREEADEGKPGAAEGALTLAPGPHLLMVQTVFDPALGAQGWRVTAKLSAGAAPEQDGAAGEDEAPTERPAKTLAESLSLSTAAERSLSLGDLLDVPSIEDATVSADGTLVAVTLARPAVPADDRESWMEIRRAADGAPVRTFRGEGGGPGAFTWAPSGHRYLFTSGDDTTTLWIGDLDAGVTVPLASGIEGFDDVVWSPDGSFVVYTASEEEAADDSGFKRLRSLEDRWPGWRRRGSLYQVHVPETLEPGAEVPAHPVVRRLTSGDKTTSLVDIAPDGSRLLFTRTELLADRPFSADHLFELPLDGDTLAPRELARLEWLGGALYSPDGRQLVIAGGPTTFGAEGEAVAAGEIPNDYDTQAYLYDLATGTARCLTRDYAPAIGSAAWSPDGTAIYFQVIDGPFVRIVRHDLAAGTFTPLDTGVDVVGGMDLSRDGSRLVYVGSSDDTPARVMSLALVPGGGASAGRSGAPVTVYRPGAARFDQVRIGRVEDFSFTAASGTKIVGRVHYPPGFDPQAAAAASMPAIVYYYGGTVPVDRSFGGRYPFNLWAADGYVVYVLQPSGAIGFGQEFSARHVNDWGKVAGEEIIEGTKAFLAAHPFVDPKRVGCGGASYGGFMTMYLVTQTDIFRAAIAHAGISSLASYWGEGWWGFQYSGVASAGSYPWNRQDLYVGQSPLFHADKIHTPLLLLHGTADTNVPIGESLQLFTALKILDRPVELVTIAGENHHILDYPKRVRWMETILAWYDRELKGEPGWWDHLYPAEDGP